MAETIELEIWADSFHEGNWVCEELSNFFEPISLEYINGYIPKYKYKIDENNELVCTVFGRYDNWEPIPDKVLNVKSLGKPDMIIYHPSKDEVILSIEETAAIPTGNQSMQRCERFYGSSREHVPFWYLIGEFGVHKDGGVRRDSIWPTILSIRLSNIFKTPSIVLHYSDKENPEDYSVGEGVNTLFQTVSNYIKLELGLFSNDELIEELSLQYQHMFEFIHSQADSIVNYLPSMDLLKDKSLPKLIAKSAVNGEDPDSKLNGFLVWPKTDGLPKDIYNEISPDGVINSDPLIDRMEGLVSNKQAYNIIKGAGSKPQKISSINNWIEEQKKNWDNSSISKKKKLNYDNLRFETTENGNYHLTTAKNVFYLVDSSSSMETLLKDSFSYNDEINFGEDQPVFFYISNSMLKGRIFGDPFTGQLSAYSNIFTKNNLNQRTRLSITYYPYQVHTQMFKSDGVFNKNKGIDICRELVDYAIFHEGVIVNMKTGDIIC